MEGLVLGKGTLVRVAYRDEERAEVRVQGSERHLKEGQGGRCWALGDGVGSRETLLLEVGGNACRNKSWVRVRLFQQRQRGRSRD
jgi:hypothetical protein